MTARLGILLSGGGSTYANLEAAIAAGRVPATVAVVVASKPGIGGIDHAERFARPWVQARQADAVTAALMAHQVTHVAMCGWLHFWNPPAAFAGRTVNVHPSLLPRHGGKGMYGIHVHRAVLAAGDRESGCTVHLVEGAYDSGRILAQVRVPVLPGDTAEALQARVQAAEREVYPSVIADLVAGRLDL